MICADDVCDDCFMISNAQRLHELHGSCFVLRALSRQGRVRPQTPIGILDQPRFWNQLKGAVASRTVCAASQPKASCVTGCQAILRE